MPNERVRRKLASFIVKNVRSARSVYWYNRVINFGDLLTPVLMKHYGYRAIHFGPKVAGIVAVGSLIQHLPSDYSGVILGAGLIEDRRHSLPYAKFRAVRGPLTRDNLNAPSDVVLGDPGLLANRLLAQRQTKQYTLGLVPHLVDRNDHRVINLQTRYPDHVCIIDVQNEPYKVIREIDRCEYIVSSSLHGLIVADSLGIPGNWTQLSDRVIGNGFKFRDHNKTVKARSTSTILEEKSNLADILKTTRIPCADLDAVTGCLERLFQAI